MSPIRNKEELEEFFHSSGKPRRQWRVGTEYEKVGIDRRSGKAIPYSGPRGVEAILRALIEEYGWESHEEYGYVIALSREKAQITL